MSSLDIFSVPSTDYDLQGYRMVPYHKLSSSITPMKFSVKALDDYVDLNRSYFVVDLRLYSSSTNGIVADDNTASDADDHSSSCTPSTTWPTRSSSKSTCGSMAP